MLNNHESDTVKYGLSYPGDCVAIPNHYTLGDASLACYDVTPEFWVLRLMQVLIYILSVKGSDMCIRFELSSETKIENVLEEALSSARKKGVLPNSSYDPSDFAIAYPNERLPIPNSSLLGAVITDEIKELWLIDKHMEIIVWCSHPGHKKETIKLTLKVSSTLSIENVLAKVLVVVKSKGLLVNPSYDPSEFSLRSSSGGDLKSNLVPNSSLLGKVTNKCLDTPEFWLYQKEEKKAISIEEEKSHYRDSRMLFDQIEYVLDVIRRLFKYDYDIRCQLAKSKKEALARLPLLERQKSGTLRPPIITSESNLKEKEACRLRHQCSVITTLLARQSINRKIDRMDDTFLDTMTALRKNDLRDIMKNYITGVVTSTFTDGWSIGGSVRMMSIAWPLLEKIFPPPPIFTGIVADTVSTYYDNLNIIESNHKNLKAIVKSFITRRFRALDGKKKSSSVPVINSQGSMLDLGIDGFHVNETEEEDEGEGLNFFQKMDALCSDLDDIARCTSIPAILDFFTVIYMRRIKYQLENGDGELGKLSRSKKKKGTVSAQDMIQANLTTTTCVRIIEAIQKFGPVLKKMLRYNKKEFEQKNHTLSIHVDKFMDQYDSHSRNKIVSWVDNILAAEKVAVPEFRKTKGYYYTTGPEDLFCNINSAFSVAVEEHNLLGQALARVAMLYGHVISYFQVRLLRHCHKQKHFRPPTILPPQGKSFIKKKPPKGKEEAIIYLLGQINNYTLYESHAEDMKEYCVNALADGDASNKTEVENQFDCAIEGFYHFTAECVGILVQWVELNFSIFLPPFFTAKWLNHHPNDSNDIRDRFTQVFADLPQKIERELFREVLVRKSMHSLISVYFARFTQNVSFLKKCKPKQLLDRIKEDQAMFTLYFTQTYGDLLRSKSIETEMLPLKWLEVLLDEHPGMDIIKICTSNLLHRFHKSSTLLTAECTPAKIARAVLTIRTDLDKQEMKALSAFCIAKDTNMVESSSTLLLRMEITVLQGRNLLKNGEWFNPLVQLRLQNSEHNDLAKRKTRHISKRKRPHWGKTFCDFDPQILAHFEFLIIEVWAMHSATRKKEFVAEGQITIDEIRRGQLRKGSIGSAVESKVCGYECWVKLQPNDEKKEWDSIEGDVRMRIKYFMGGFQDNPHSNQADDVEDENQSPTALAMEIFRDQVHKKRDMSRRDLMHIPNLNRRRTQEFVRRIHNTKKPRKKIWSPRKIKLDH